MDWIEDGPGGVPHRRGPSPIIVFRPDFQMESPSKTEDLRSSPGARVTPMAAGRDQQKNPALVSKRGVCIFLDDHVKSSAPRTRTSPHWLGSYNAHPGLRYRRSLAIAAAVARTKVRVARTCPIWGRTTSRKSASSFRCLPDLTGAPAKGSPDCAEILKMLSGGKLQRRHASTIYTAGSRLYLGDRLREVVDRFAVGVGES